MEKLKAIEEKIIKRNEGFNRILEDILKDKDGIGVEEYNQLSVLNNLITKNEELLLTISIQIMQEERREKNKKEA